MERVILVSTGEREDALARLEAGFASHFTGIPLETLRLGNVPSLHDAYFRAAQLVNDDRAWLIFAHQDVRPALPGSGGGERDVATLSGMPPFLREAVRKPEGWIAHARTLLDRPDTGFIGVAGALGLGRDAAWWNYTELTGAVVHSRPNSGLRFNAYGPWARAVVLDGLCLMARAGLFARLEPPRQEEPRFHFYDLELTLKAHFAGLKNWTVPLLLLHESGGATIEDEGWREDRRRFLETFSSRLPVSVPFEPLIEGL